MKLCKTHLRCATHTVTLQTLSSSLPKCPASMPASLYVLFDLIFHVKIDLIWTCLCGLQVSHDDKGATSVSFLEGVDVRRPGRVADLLARAMRQRAVGATATNEHSSRSHMVFSLNITGSNAASGQQVHGGRPATICMHVSHFGPLAKVLLHSAAFCYNSNNSLPSNARYLLGVSLTLF